MTTQKPCTTYLIYGIAAAVLATGAFLAFPTTAQEVPPPESQLQTPGGEVPVLDAPAMPAPADAGQTQGAAAGPGTAPAQKTPETTGDLPPPSSENDPCPAAKNLSGNAPDDLAKVQEEIDRFTLCVQRATLVDRLNENALKAEKAQDAALGYSPSVPGLPDPQKSGDAAMGLAPLPAAALAGVDVTPNPNDDKSIPDGTSAKDAPKSDLTGENTPAPVPAEPKAWTIGEVFGAGSDVQAKLLSPEGDEVKVRIGTKLPDGKGTVVKITPSGVSIRVGSEVKPLEWAR